MNNYLDLLDTELGINIELVLKSHNGHATVVINDITLYCGAVIGTIILTHTVPLLVPINLSVQHNDVYLASLKFDGWESRPQHIWEVDGMFTLDTKVLFYQWQHHATAQGWLLMPTQ